MIAISIMLNGKVIVGSAEPRTHLADFIREACNLTGTHLGCEHGVCGACTLLIDGAPARSCITYAVMCEGAHITTIEGLGEDEITRGLRSAFKSEHALQCGYCTPGMLVSARDIVLRLAEPIEADIRVAMSGNLCRCTGYVGIIRAIQSVIVQRRADGVAPIPGGGRNALGPVGAGRRIAADGMRVSVTHKAPTPALGSSASRSELKARALDLNWKPQATFDQVFIVPSSREVVWEFFGRIEDVAACLPGVVLSGAPTLQHTAGRIKVKVGLISAEFRGVAAIERDHSDFTGWIRGEGTDARANSVTRGEVRYRLLPAENGAATRVELSIGYSLTGMLAQLGRSGIVQDVAARLTASFAQNVSARLSGTTGEGRPPLVAARAELNAGTLVLSILSARIKAFVCALIGRS